MNFKNETNRYAEKTYLKKEKLIIDPKYVKAKGCNPCPMCGFDIYSIITEGPNSTYRYNIGCRKCGMEHGLSTLYSPEEPLHEELVLRLSWNAKFYGTKLTPKAMQTTGINNGDYLVADSMDGDIMYVSESIEEVENLIIHLPEDTYIKIYHVEDGLMREVEKI